MASEAKFLALDLGAESGRAVVGLFDGEKIKLEEAHRFPNGPTVIHRALYWDVLHLYNEVKNGIKSAVERYGGDFASIGIDTWGVDFGLFDRNGELLSNPRHYRDPRTNGMMEAVFRIVPRSEVFFSTGIQFMQLNTLYQLFAMKNEGSPLLEAADKMLMMPDIFNYWLTGSMVSEFTEATTSQMYDPQKGRWAIELLERLGIPTRFLPEIVQPGTSLGPLTQSVADEIGVRPIPVTAPATHDTGSAVAAVPASTDDFVYLSSGTWSLMGVEVEKPLISERVLELNFTNEGAASGGFRLLKNIMGLWLVQECRRTWARAGRDRTYQELTEMAASESPFASLVDPDNPEFLHPGDMPMRIQQFCARTGQKVPETEGAIIRCALDSLALKYRQVLEMLEELLGRRMQVIHIVGGGCQNRLLNQLAANVTQRTVVAGPVEATALGNVLVQAVSAGEVGSLGEIRQIVKHSYQPEVYEPHTTGGEEEAYRRYLALMSQAVPDRARASDRNE